MDSVRYAEAAAGLVNTDLSSVDEARDAVQAVTDVGGRGRTRAGGPSASAGAMDERDLKSLQRFQRDLRTAFERGAAGDGDGVVDVLNDLLVRHPVTPVVSPAGHRGRQLEAYVAGYSPARRVVAESLLALAQLACEHGPTRLGVCGADRCTNVFVDTSPNASRRYCSDRCSSRANVAAYRARQKAARHQDARAGRVGGPGSTGSRGSEDLRGRHSA